MILIDQFNLGFPWSLPCNFSTPLGLFSHFRQLPVVALFSKELGCLWRLEAMQCALSQSPLCLPLSSSIILLCCEGSLDCSVQEKGSINHTAKPFFLFSFFFFICHWCRYGTLFWRSVSQALPVNAYRIKNLRISRGK